VVGTSGVPRRILITAGPTHEPIDAVRFIGNRSSGRLGIALAVEAAGRGWETTLLLGPVPQTPEDSAVRVRRFRTAADLEALLAEEVARTDLLVMAAAVADYRPRPEETDPGGKRRRTGEGLVLRLESTPDLLAGCGALRRAGQVFVGFALEPAAELMASAESKLRRKGLDLIVANPLETMDAPGIEATLIGRSGVVARTGGVIDKEAFAPWLLEHVEGRWAELAEADVRGG
jgi:phosphopantothenoylcysteine decarboxylase/phosphopantothenate--cysteine ligase